MIASKPTQHTEARKENAQILVLEDEGKSTNVPRSSLTKKATMVTLSFYANALKMKHNSENNHHPVGKLFCPSAQSQSVSPSAKKPRFYNYDQATTSSQSSRVVVIKESFIGMMRIVVIDPQISKKVPNLHHSKPYISFLARINIFIPTYCIFSHLFSNMKLCSLASWLVSLIFIELPFYPQNDKMLVRGNPSSFGAHMVILDIPNGLPIPNTHYNNHISPWNVYNSKYWI